MRTSGSPEAIGWIFCLGVWLDGAHQFPGKSVEKIFFRRISPPENPHLSSDDFIRPKVKLTFTKGISVLYAIMSVSLPPALLLPPPVEEDGSAVPAAGTWKGCKKAIKPLG